MQKGEKKTDARMRKYRVVIAYDGTAYSGWQYQENAVGIQQVVEEALAYLDGAPVRVYGSSRTDAGVHAKGFVAHFHLTKPIPAKNLVRAMNAQADILPPHLAPYWTFCHRPLDLAAMKKAASYFVGKHDFVSFAANPDRVLETTVRSVFSFEVKKAGPRYTFIVRGDGFLYKQVRSMVGFLLSVGKGNERPEAVKELLEAATPRTARVETAPARGLFLWKVFY